MMNELMTQLQPVIISICVTILTAIASYVGMKVKHLFEEKVNTETKLKVVETTCKYVDQVYKDIHGREKFETAKDAIVDQLNKKGIEITDLELEVMIESVVKGFKDGFSQGVIEEPIKPVEIPEDKTEILTTNND